MRTSKPISTISYNSPQFLQAKLEEFTRNHVLSAWFFVQHRAEKDERKDHIHVYAVPNKMLDTMCLQDALRELDPSNPSKPLGCIDFCSSKSDDAALYFSHDEDYLAWKGERREYHYGYDEFTYSDADWFEDIVYHAYHASDFASKSKVIKALREGVSPVDIVMTGLAPIQMATSLRALVQMAREEQEPVERNGRRKHE